MTNEYWNSLPDRLRQLLFVHMEFWKEGIDYTNLTPEQYKSFGKQINIFHSYRKWKKMEIYHRILPPDELSEEQIEIFRTLPYICTWIDWNLRI